jgi:hypothetical protein
VLMADADAALYRAKKAGRATFAIHGQAMAPARQGARPRDRGLNELTAGRRAVPGLVFRAQ